MFTTLSEIYGAAELKTVRRQEVAWQKQLSEALSEGRVGEGVKILHAHGRLHWSTDETLAIKNLISHWERERLRAEVAVLASRNKDVTALNKAMHDMRFSKGELGNAEFEVLGAKGRITVSKGDKIIFERSSKELGVLTDQRGTLSKVHESERGIAFEVDLGKRKATTFNPTTFHGFNLGYAATVHKSQGKPSEFQKAYCSKSAERFADLVQGYCAIHQSDPSYEVSSKLSMRAQFEEKRYRELSAHLNNKEASLSHEVLIKNRVKAERLSGIEGRF